MTSSYPRQGEVYYLIKASKALGDTKARLALGKETLSEGVSFRAPRFLAQKRPAVIISMNLRNQYKENVLIVPFISDLTSEETPTRILISEGEGGL